MSDLNKAINGACTDDECRADSMPIKMYMFKTLFETSRKQAASHPTGILPMLEIIIFFMSKKRTCQMAMTMTMIGCNILCDW
jgi:hypothetical protein